MLESITAWGEEELASPNTQQITKKYLKTSPHKTKPNIFLSWNMCELIPLLMRKMSPATPCPSDHTTLAQGRVGSELFWNHNGAFKKEKHLKECQTSSILSLVLSYEWENIMKVELWYSQFPPPIWPTCSLG